MKISIITPSFNQSEFIERTILSVISQSWDFELEYIIMDWWSNDWSLEIIKKYENLLIRWKIEINCTKIDFIWKSEKDKWQSDAINKWLKLATWDIVAYLNSDDTHIPWALQKVIDYLWNSDKKWSYGKCRIIDKFDIEIRKWITLYKNILGRNFSYSKLLTENYISQMTVFWKREIMDDIWYFNENEHLCMDYEYWLRLWSKYNPVYISEYIANFRFYQTSKSGSRFKIQFKDELRLAEKYAGWKYKFSLLLHSFNYYKIVFIYKILSFLKI
ncbi:MAG: glycosyl transferase family protein [uncultured bacterium (gcode 4)]|uniref:Glycosyl transferase family protein n=1 Tax=uncultured bacterium (gcode 4) TaxID=1234023 RepID=K2GSD3_9BACT|nr:MAG: glycosyl transferase family protein [uncultured bacterium (gcode 4)]